MRTLGLIGGTGLDSWGKPDSEQRIDTPYGSPSGPLRCFSFPNARLLFLPRHGESHEIAPHEINYRANIRALKDAGAEEVIAVNAVGGIGEVYGTGVLALPEQLIDYTWGREHSFSSGSGAQLQHIDFTRPFSSKLTAELNWSAKMAGIEMIDGGCIAVTQGPRLETAAEIRRLENDGCDLVGMTTMPEAALASELGLEYATIAMVVNRAAGKSDLPISISEVEQQASECVESVRKILDVVLNGPGQA